MAPRKQQKKFTPSASAAGPDLYAELGLARNATINDVKRAYRRLALQCHPDKCPGDEAAHEKFQRISLAYSVLSDEQKRRYYDQTGTTEGLDISPDEFMDMFQSLLLEIIGGADMIRDMLSCFSPRELARLPPFPFPKELFPPGTFPAGLRFSSKGLKGLPPQVEELIQNGDMHSIFAAMSGMSPTGSGGTGRSHGSGGGRRRRCHNDDRGSGDREGQLPARDPLGFGGCAAPPASISLLGALLGDFGLDEAGFAGSDNEELGDSGSSNESEWTDVSESELEEMLSQRRASQEHHCDSDGSTAPVAVGLSSSPRTAPSPPPQSHGTHFTDAGAQPQQMQDAEKPHTSFTAGAEAVSGCTREPPTPAPLTCTSGLAPAAADASSSPSLRLAPTSSHHQQQTSASPLLIRNWIMAARSGDVGTLQMLLDQEPRLLNCRGTGMGHTALHWCAAKGTVEGLRWLLRKGIDINIRNDDGATPLHAAARNGRLEAVEALLAWRVPACTGFTGTQHPDTPAESAVSASAANPAATTITPREAVATVSTIACNLAAVDGEGHTALQLAVEFQHAQVAALLRQAASEREAQAWGTVPLAVPPAFNPGKAGVRRSNGEVAAPMMSAMAVEAADTVRGDVCKTAPCSARNDVCCSEREKTFQPDGGRRCSNSSVNGVSSAPACRAETTATTAAAAVTVEPGTSEAVDLSGLGRSEDGASASAGCSGTVDGGAREARSGDYVSIIRWDGITSGQPSGDRPQPLEEHNPWQHPQTGLHQMGQEALAAQDGVAAKSPNVIVIGSSATGTGGGSAPSSAHQLQPQVQQQQPAWRSVLTLEEKAARRAALMEADAAAEREEARREAEKTAQAEAAAAAAGLRSRDEGKAWLEAARRGDLATLQHMLADNSRLLHYRGQGTNFAFTLHTALHWAVAKGYTAVSRWLLQQGADPDLPNAAGTTPLHVAASQRSDECARLLVLEAAAKMGVVDSLGETVRDILLRRDASGNDNSGSCGGGGGGGAQLAAELELLARVVALRDAADGSSHWTPRMMRGLLAAAGVNPAGLFERQELVEACNLLIARYPPRISVTPATAAPPTVAVSKAAAAMPGTSSRGAAVSATAGSSCGEAPPQRQPVGSIPADGPAVTMMNDGGDGSAGAAAGAAAASVAAKQRGNEAFSRGDYAKSVSHYTMAMRLQSEPSAVLYSNRAAAYCGMSYFGKAQADAEEAIRLDPQQPKYCCRLGVALLGQLQFREAEAAFRAALKLNPSYAAAMQGLADVRAAASRSAH